MEYKEIAIILIFLVSLTGLLTGIELSENTSENSDGEVSEVVYEDLNGTITIYLEENPKNIETNFF